MGVQPAVSITQPHKHGKLGLSATKMMFIRYPAQSKGHGMYGERSNGGMRKIDSRNVDFLNDELPTIGEIHKDVELFEFK